MSTKKWLLGVFGGALLAGAATTVQAASGINIDLKLVSINNTALANVSADYAASEKSAKVLKAGDTFTFDVWAQVYGNNATADEGVKAVAGSLVTTAQKGAGAVTSGGLSYACPTYVLGEDADGLPVWQEVPGVFASVRIPFDANGAQGGDLKNLKSYGKGDDGVTDIGDEPNSGQGLFGFQGWSTAMVGPENEKVIPTTLLLPGDDRLAGVQKSFTGPAGEKGRQFRLGTYTLTVGTGGVGGAETAVNFFYKTDLAGNITDNAALYRVDNALVGTSASSGNPTVGAPIVLTAVPEPAGLSVLALGALGLLARRRK